VEADDTPETSAGVIVMRGSGKLRLLKCSFLQKDLPQPPFIEERRQRVPLADVLVDNGDAPNELPRIELERCYFHSGKFADSGQVAIGLHSPPR